MFQCAILTCAMIFYQGSRQRDGLVEQIRPHAGSDDISWVRPAKQANPVHIRGPMWTRGMAVHHKPDKSVWITPGQPGLGTTFGVRVALDF